MPVSKKRKKDGKPVHRSEAPHVEGEAHPHGPEGKPAPVLVTRVGKPSNPFVGGKPTARASQRGR